MLFPSDFEIRQVALDSALALGGYDRNPDAYRVKLIAEEFYAFLTGDSDSKPDTEDGYLDCAVNQCAPCETTECAPPPQEEISIVATPYTVVRVNGVRVWS